MALTLLAPIGVVTKVTLNGTVVAGDLIGFDGTGYVQADANATASIRAQYIAIDPGVAGAVIRATDKARVSTTGLTAGGLVFASATAGGITQTDPGTATAFPQVLGLAKSTTEVDLDCNYPHFYVATKIPGILPATATNFGYFWTAPMPCRLVGIYEVHRTAGTNGGAVSLDIEKLITGTAQDSGVVMNTASIDLKSTADTPTYTKAIATAASARLDVGDSLALKDTGTLTALADMAVTCILVPEL